MSRHSSLIAASIVAFAPALVTSAAAQQVSDDVDVNLDVTVTPSITIESPAASDFQCSSTGNNPTCTPSSTNVCFATNLTDVRVTVSALNGVQGGEWTLVSPDVPGDYVSYVFADFSGVTGTSAGANWATSSTRDISLAAAITGFGTCGATDFSFVASVDFTNPFSGTLHRSVQQVIADNNLADGVTRTFSDTLTITFEPVL